MARIRFFPLDLTYKVVDNKPEIWVFGRTADAKQLVVIDRSFSPYFYVVPKKGEDIRERVKALGVERDGTSYEVTKVEAVKKKFLGKDVDALKVFVNLPAAVPVIRSELKAWKAVDGTFEFDIPFVRRYLIDSKMTPMALTEVDGSTIAVRARVPAVLAEAVKPSEDETMKEPNILAFDIEVYNPAGKSFLPEKHPIVMVSFYGKDYRKVITWKRFRTKEKYIEFVNSEAELIDRFKAVVESIKPDILAGYFSDAFDLPYIEARAKKYRIKLDLGLDYSELSVSKRQDAKSRITGIIHLDVCKFIQKTMAASLETDSFSLGAVSEELLGEKKLDVEINSLANVWDNEPERLGPYCEYNLHDSMLTFGLAERFFQNIVEMAKIVCMPAYDLTRAGFSQMVEGYLVRQAPGFNEIAPNKPTHDEIRERRLHTYKGAFVFEPKPGLYKDIVIFDFRSLYPSIISSHNISPATFRCSCCEGSYAPVEDGKKKYWFCRKKKGFIPLLIEDLIERRMRIKDMLKVHKDRALMARQETLKLLANAFYGYLGFFGARWYSLESAKSVTAWGRHYIQKVIEDAANEKFKVIYSDTDSIFITLDSRSRNEAMKFAERVNQSLPEPMELEFEGFYPRGIFVSAKLSPYGAKKKYALLSEDGRIIITGFETVRRNWSFIAKDVQREVLGIILKENKPEKALGYVKKVIDDLRQNKVPVEKVIIHTQLQKEISDYSSVGPHVAAASLMRKKGFDIGPGSMIEFVVVKGKGRIRDKVKLPADTSEEDYDSDYYINNQVIPGVGRIFSVLGYSENELIEKADQSKLKKFF